MNIVKSCGPQVLYRCKHCQKCIKGREAFINHKRENHNDVLEQRRNDEQKCELVESQPAHKYRPGPKSKKAQLLINLPEEKVFGARVKALPRPTLEPDSTTDGLTPKAEVDSTLLVSTRKSDEWKSTEPDNPGAESDKDSGNDMSTAETVSCSSGNGSLMDSLMGRISSDTIGIEGDDDDIVIISGNNPPQHTQSEPDPEGSAERSASEGEGDDDIQIIAVLPLLENASRHVAASSNVVPFTYANPNSENYQCSPARPTLNQSSSNHIAPSDFMEDMQRSDIEEVTPQASNVRPSNGYISTSRLSENAPRDWEETNHEEDSGRYFAGSVTMGEVVPICRSSESENDTTVPLNSNATKASIESINEDDGLQNNLEHFSDRKNHSLPSTVASDEYPEDIMADSQDELDFIPQITSVYSEAIRGPSGDDNISKSPSSSSLMPRINILPVNKARYRFKCWSCDEVFSKKKDRSAHAKVSHGSTIPFKCSICSESFAQERSLMRHKNTHFQYPCTVCLRKFDGKAEFDAHMKLHEKKLRKVMLPQTETAPQSETLALEVTEQLKTSPARNLAPVVTVREAWRLIKEAQPREDGRYPCVICSTHLKNKASLRLHFRMHTGEKPYKCRHCSLAFVQFNHRLRHELKAHANTKLPTLVNRFSKSVRPSQPVNIAERRIPKLKTLISPTKLTAPRSCDDTESSQGMSLEEALAFLRLARIGPNQKFQCPVCPAQPKSKVTLKLHLRLHTGEKPHKCGICNGRFRQHSQRKKHEIRIHGRTLRQCGLCPEKFLDPMKLKIHQACHRGQKVLRCRVCPEMFDGVKSRQDHENQHSIKAMQRFNSVPVSQTSAETIYSLNSTRRVSGGHAAKRYYCPQCPQIYRYPHQLKTHMGTHGDAWKAFKCSYCPQKFARPEACNYHENSHTGNRPFKCNNCPKAYPHPMSLLYHKNTVHKGEDLMESKPPEPSPPTTLTKRQVSPKKVEDNLIEYECSFCEKTFRNYTHQREHERTHTGEKPYQCQFCDKSFAQSSPWKYHQNTHTGARPFECSKCGMTFSTPSDRAQHERSTHGYSSGSPRTATCANASARFSLAEAFSTTAFADPEKKECKLEASPLRKQPSSTRSGTAKSQAEPFYDCRFCRRSFDDTMALRFHEMTHPQSRNVLLSTPGNKPSKSTFLSNAIGSQVRIQKEPQPTKLRRQPVSPLIRSTKVTIEGTPFLCRHCGKDFPGPKHLEYHENVHTGARPFECSFCPRAFAHPANLRKHLSVMHGAESNSTTASHPKLENNPEEIAPVHLVTTSLETEEPESFDPARHHTCQFCPKTFPSINKLKYHENTHTGARPFRCGYCPKGFAHPSNRRVHILSAHGNEFEEGKFPGLEQSAYIEDSIPSLSQSSTPNFLQPQVDQAYKQDSSDQTGRRVLRTQQAGPEGQLGEGPYRCQHCDRRFTQKNSRNYHENLHTGALPYKCSLCSKAFYHPSMRSKHMAASHSSEIRTVTSSQTQSSNLTPTLPPGISSTRSTRKEHDFTLPAYPLLGTSNALSIPPVTSAPSVNGPVSSIRILRPLKRKRKGRPQHKYGKVKCTMCDKSFRKDYLPIHIRYHTDERIYPCELCDLSFHHSQALKDHFRRKHTDERPYECETCDKRFSVPADLHLHRKTHQLRQRKHVCNVCGKKFLTSADLKGHSLTHSRPFPCSHCDKTFQLQLHMEDHVRVAHTREQPFQCLRCLQRFSSQITFIKHVDRQSCVPKVSISDRNQGASASSEVPHGIDEQSKFSYDCSLCNCSFSQKELAAAHARWHQGQYQD